MSRMAHPALRESGRPAASDVPAKGGSAVAAALDALLYHPSSTSEEKQ